LANILKIKSDLKAFNLSGFLGLNNKDDSTQIPDGMAQDLRNVIVTNKEVSKRYGYTALNTTEISSSSGVYGLFPFYYNNGASKKLIAVSGTAIYEYVSATGLFSSINTGLTASLRTRAETFHDLLISVNGTDAVQKYNGTTSAVLGGSPPICKSVKLHKNYLFLAGNATYPSRLYWCDLDTPETWNALSFVDVNPNDGDLITGLDVSFDSLIITKEYNTYLLYGDTPTYTEGLTLWRIKRANTSSGSVNQGSIAMTGQGLIDLSRNAGVQAMGGATTDTTLNFDALRSNMLSADISPVIAGINESRITQAEAISWDNKYILSVPYGSSTTNNLNLVYDYYAGGWVIWNIPANNWCIYRDSGVDNLFFGSCTDGFVHKITKNIYNDNGSAISAYYKTKDIDSGSPSNDKIYRRYYMTLNKSDDFGVTVEHNVDFGDSTDTNIVAAQASASLWDVAVWDVSKWGEATTSTTRVDMNERGKYINYKFSNAVLNENMRIRNLTQYYRLKGSR
jgi:hypothetical protein